ncbi:hypothetical protein CsatB_005940 [Cannabis sativa]
MENSNIPIPHTIYSILVVFVVLLIHSSSHATATTKTTTITKATSKDQVPCSSMCYGCGNPCEPLPSPPPPVIECPPPPAPPPPSPPPVIECPPPPAPPPQSPPPPKGPECPPPPKPPCQENTCGGEDEDGHIIYPNPPFMPYGDAPPASYFPNYNMPQSYYSSSFTIYPNHGALINYVIFALLAIIYLL